MPKTSAYRPVLFASGWYVVDMSIDAQARVDGPFPDGRDCEDRCRTMQALLAPENWPAWLPGKPK